MHSIRQLCCVDLVLTPKTTTIYTYFVAFCIFVVGEHVYFKFVMQVDRS